ncbi:MAG: type II CAAX prenyl endopeptidase Rce1 family protein [Flavobacteriales bacterium]
MKHPLIGFSNRSRLMLFVALVFIFFALASVLTGLVCMKYFNCSIDEIRTKIDSLQEGVGGVLIWMSNVSQPVTFLFPVLMFYWLVGKPSQHGLLLQRWNIWVWMSPLLIISASGLIDWAAMLNEALIPEGSWLESVFKPQEQEATKLTERILHATDIPWWTIYLSISIIPAICEEMFFRGLLQPLLSSIYRNHHIGIWITAGIFSLIHFQFYGFLPRLLLGALLGYLMVWSGSLWSSMFAHAVNNATAILVFNAYGSTNPPDESWITSIYTSLGAMLLFGVITYLLYTKRSSSSVEFTYASVAPPPSESPQAL